MMEKDWLFATDAYICDLRTVAVVMKDNKVLVQREKDGTEYALPGGHVKIGETLEEGLIREMREEMGADILCRRLIWSEECFWEWHGRKAHGIAFYYLAEFAENAEIFAGRLAADRGASERGGVSHVFEERNFAFGWTDQAFCFARLTKINKP